MRAIVLLGVLLSVAHAAPEVVRLVTAERIANRQPEGVVARFPTEGKVFAWAHLRNAGAPTEITWVWRRDGAVMHRKTSKVGGYTQRWRIWSRRWLHPQHAGAWQVSLEHGGETLAEARFVVGPEAPTADTPATPAPEATSVTAPTAPRAAEPTPEPPVAEAPPTEVAEPPPAPGGPHCVAWLNVRGRDGRFSVLEVDVAHPAVPARTAPGLVVLDDRQPYALAKMPFADQRTGLHGSADHRWDELWGVAVPGGRPHRWAGMPARLPAPTDRVAPNRPRHEVNLLEIHSVIGPYVGLRQGLTGDAGGKHGFDHSRFVTVIAPGETADPTILLEDDLVPRALLRARTLRPSPDDAPDPKRHDFRRSALSPQPGGLQLLTLMPCCSWGENRGHLRVDVPVVPQPPVRAHLPDAEGWWRALDGCGRVRVIDGRVEAALRGAGAHPVALPQVQPAAVIGVAWPEADLNVGLNELRRAGHKLLKSNEKK